MQAGAFDAALGLLATAEAGPLDELGRARTDLLRAEVAYSHDRGSEAPPLLLRAAKTLEPLDAALARETYLDAWGASLFAGRLAERRRSARRIAGPRRPPPARRTLRGRPICCSTASRCCSPKVRTQRRPLSRRRRPRSPAMRSPSRRCCAGGGWRQRPPPRSGTTRRCVAISARGVELARDSGALAVLAVGVNVLGQVVALGGDFAKAASLVAEADAVTEATGARVAPYAALGARRVARPGGRGLLAHRDHHQGRHRRRPGDGGASTHTGRPRSSRTPRPLRGRARCRRSARATTPASCSCPRGRSPS